VKRVLIVTACLAVAGFSLTAAALAQESGANDPSATHAARVVVPRVVGMRMDRATRTLKSRGLRVNEECNGLFGCIVKSQWWICHQNPRPGTKVRRYRVVVIYGERRGRC
jgi:hypothetical protein